MYQKRYGDVYLCYNYSQVSLSVLLKQTHLPRIESLRLQLCIL
uniref:Uncharacterized protein n=1 Tax=Anguilla anguilla TaxID=7936 RepID=A0A0E9R0Q1_ANGAN